MSAQIVGAGLVPVQNRKMFTGIIEELGIVKSISRRGAIALLSINAQKVIEDAKIGDSIALNGACLTVAAIGKNSLSFELLSETSARTNLGKLKIGEKLNLERSLKVGDRLPGHFVTGHIDCVGTIRNKTHVSGNLCFEIVIPQEFLKFVALKGSVAVDGISLTVTNTRSNMFRVYIIPHTLQNTTLFFKGPSALVNIECDILAKYQSQHTSFSSRI